MDYEACVSQSIWWEYAHYTKFSSYYCQNSACCLPAAVCSGHLFMSPYLLNDSIRQTAIRPGASELSGSQQYHLNLWEQEPQVTPAHGSPETFTPGTVLAKRLGFKTNSRLGFKTNSSCRTRANRTFYLFAQDTRESLLTESGYPILTLNICFKGHSSFCKPCCMCLFLLLK